MRRTHASGFSLIELMVTIAIVAILLAVAFPSFEGSLRSNRVATGTNELLASLSLARSEAIRNPAGAALCTSTDGAACGGDWNDGWLVWLDLNQNGEVNPGERVIRYVEGNDRLVLAAVSTSADPTLIQFDVRGRANDTYTIDLQPDNCPTGQQLIREFTVNPTGQVTVDREEVCA